MTPDEIARSLTGAQRDTMRGHMVEIPPEEAEQLEAWGLKLPEYTVREVVTRRVWPITEKGLAVRAAIERMNDEQ